MIIDEDQLRQKSQPNTSGVSNSKRNKNTPIPERWINIKNEVMGLDVGALAKEISKKNCMSLLRELTQEYEKIKVKKRRTKITTDMTKQLEHEFQKIANWNRAQRKRIADELEIKEYTVYKWNWDR